VQVLRREPKKRAEARKSHHCVGILRELDIGVNRGLVLWGGSSTWGGRVLETEKSLVKCALMTLQVTLRQVQGCL